VFTHESFGHKSEADFMLGDQTAKNEWKIGTKVAADCVSIVDFGGEEENSGYCPIDDEGVIKQKTYLIKNGILQGRLHSLATAAEFGEQPTGNARAISFEFEPIVRMTNTYIEAGQQTESELIAKVKEGLYLADVRHGSGLSTFTIAPIKAYWIRDGKLAEPVKVPVVSGTVFDTLNKISGVAKKVGIQSSAFGGCGKDEQAPLRVADGGPVILIDEMQVG
jgi:TldD protein